MSLYGHINSRVTVAKALSQEAATHVKQNSKVSSVVLYCELTDFSKIDYTCASRNNRNMAFKACVSTSACPSTSFARVPATGGPPALRAD